MFKISIFTLILVFLAGFLTASAVVFIPIASATGNVVASDQLSPGNHVDESQINVYSDRVVLDIPDVKWAKFADTNSMDPFFDSTANALQLTPTSASDIVVGDVVSYSPQGSPAKHVIHRVVYIGEDDSGLYYIVKGDNNAVADPGRVRFEQIDRVLIGIIY